MNNDQAAEMLQIERERMQVLLDEATTAGLDDRAGALESGDMSDPAESLISEQEEDATTQGLRERLEAIERAEQRLKDGVYGLSIRSGLPIPSERLEADPAAELTVEEALEN
jgi:DnaK suppressor protein